jgi:mono/diheme cytochrome c family protein
MEREMRKEVLAVTSWVVMTVAAQAQDAAAGEKVFAVCKACHQIGEIGEMRARRFRAPTGLSRLRSASADIPSLIRHLSLVLAFSAISTGRRMA